MRARLLVFRLVLVPAALLSGCGVRVFERWSGTPVLTREIPAPPETLWERLSRRASALDLVVAEIRQEERLIQFDWITAPGDGRLYLHCAPAGVVGSASIRPRVLVRRRQAGSLVVIASEVRATTGMRCVSNGQFEDWLLRRLEPAIAEATAEAARD